MKGRLLRSFRQGAAFYAKCLQSRARIATSAYRARRITSIWSLQPSYSGFAHQQTLSAWQLLWDRAPCNTDTLWRKWLMSAPHGWDSPTHTHGRRNIQSQRSCVLSYPFTLQQVRPALECLRSTVSSFRSLLEVGLDIFEPRETLAGEKTIVKTDCRCAETEFSTA